MSADRNLLFGLLALQMDFVTREQLLDAMQAWLTRKADPLGLILHERGALSDEERRAVEQLVERHVARHGGDVRQSLASVRVETPVRESLAALADADARVSVASLAPATVGDAAPSLPAALPLPSGNGASRYRKLRPHAKGGLGEVSVALDEELRREVALKEIQEQHADRADFRARFIREAEITGNLEHPGIVPVHGLGSHPDGRPYYAMRFIRGESMQEAIARFHQADEGRRDPGERELSLRALLGRFVAVCNAVAYAHSRGVVHRDLKPANVMLGEYGETLVVDWGLAKVVDQPDDATSVERPVTTTGSGSTAPTAMGQAVGTPVYMPPEQARGEHDKIDHRSDVFSLGATLYAVLTGRPPFERDKHSALAAAAECRYAPARQLNARVPRALEAVCHKAMAPAAEGRYATARLLAADVERFLADEPVGAYRDPLSQSLRRWAKRNRPLVTGAAALLVAGVVGLGVGLWAVNAEKAKTELALQGEAEEKRNAEAAEKVAKVNLATAEANLARAVKAEAGANANLKQADTNFRLARQVVDECFGIAKDHPLLNQPDIRPEMRALRRLLLEKALPFYQDFRDRRPGDAAVQGAVTDQHFRVAAIRGELSEPAEAVKHYREAERIARLLIQAHPQAIDHLSDLARTLNNLGAELNNLGRNAEAGECYTEAVALARRLIPLRPKVLEHKPSLAQNLHNLAMLRKTLGDQTKSIPLHAEAVALGRELVKARPDEPIFAVNLALALNGQGVTQKDLGLRKEALQSYDDSISLYRGLITRHPAVPRYPSELASTLHNRAMLLDEVGRPKEALASYTEAIALRRQVVAAQPDVPRYQVTLARTLNNLGLLQAKLRQRAEALQSYTEAVALGRRLVRNHPEVPEFQAELSSALNSLALFQHATGQGTEALKAFDEAAQLSRRLIERQPEAGSQDLLARVMNNHGLLLQDLDRPDEARDSFAASVELRRRLVRVSPDLPDYRHTLAGSLKNLGRLQFLAGRVEEALRVYTEVAALSRQLNRQRLGVPAYLDAGAYGAFRLGEAQSALGRREAAARSFAEAVGLWRGLSEARPDEPHYRYDLALALFQLALVQAGRGQLPEAARHEVEAAAILRALIKAHPEMWDYQYALTGTLSHLVQLQFRLGQGKEAIATSTEVIELLRRLIKAPAAAPRVLDNLARLNTPLRIRAALYSRGGQVTRAKADLDDALAAMTDLKKLDPKSPELANVYLTYIDRARLFLTLRKPAEALADFDQALAVVPPPARRWVRVQRAYGLSFTGDHDRAAVEAAELARQALPAGNVFDLARILAVSAGAVNRDPRRPLPLRERQAEARARFAVTLLGRAGRAGLFRGAGDLDYLDKDTALGFLRPRADYKAFRATLPPPPRMKTP